MTLDDNRDRVYRDAGFIAEERTELVKMSLSVPYIKNAIKARETIKGDYIAKNGSLAGYENEIRAIYDKNGWLTIDGTLNVWAMVREYELGYKGTHPSYVSPWEQERQAGKTAEGFGDKFGGGLRKAKQSWLSQLEHGIEVARQNDDRTRIRELERKIANLRESM